MRLSTRTTAWAFSNGGAGVLLVAGVFYDVAWAGWLLAGFTIAWSPLQLLGCLSEAGIQRSNEAGGPAAPLWLSSVYDFGSIAALASVGWWWTAAAYIVMWMATLNLHLEFEKHQRAA